MTTDPDVELMMLVKAGDLTAFQTLFDKYKSRVLNFCYRFCGHQGVSEELAQEVFLRVYKAAPRYRPKGRFTTWLFKIAANICLNEVRKREYRKRIESLDHMMDHVDDKKNHAFADGKTPLSDELIEAREKELYIQEALSNLPDKQRAALLLRLEGGFAYKEIARQIKCSESQVKILIYRGRQRLKSDLTKYFGES